MRSLVLTIAHSRVVGALMSFVNNECADVFGEVYLEMILNLRLNYSVISVEMFWVDR